jgi:hypothetical protein
VRRLNRSERRQRERARKAAIKTHTAWVESCAENWGGLTATERRKMRLFMTYYGHIFNGGPDGEVS